MNNMWSSKLQAYKLALKAIMETVQYVLKFRAYIVLLTARLSTNNMHPSLWSDSRQPNGRTQAEQSSSPAKSLMIT